MVLKRVTLSGRFAVPRDHEEEEDAKVTFIRGAILMGIDIAVMLGLTITLFYTFSGYIIVPVERGFYCDDPTIRKPFGPNTISTTHLLIVTLSAPFAVTLLTEAILFYESGGKNRIGKYFVTSTLLYLEYLLVYATCTFVLETIKCVVGRLRPHFIEGCKPDWSKIDCQTDPSAFVSDPLCTNTAHRVRVSRTSFPSGHTAAAVFAWLYLALYLTGIVRATGSNRLRTVRSVLLTVMTVWTAVTAITRVTDYWHHPTDVLGGFILSAAFVFVCFGRGKLAAERVFENRHITPSKEHCE